MSEGCYQLTLEQVERLILLKIQLEEVTNKIMLSKGHRLCPFQECKLDKPMQKQNNIMKKTLENIKNIYPLTHGDMRSMAADTLQEVDGIEE